MDVVNHISSCWVKIKLHIKNHLPRLPRTALVHDLHDFHDFHYFHDWIGLDRFGLVLFCLVLVGFVLVWFGLVWFGLFGNHLCYVEKKGRRDEWKKEGRDNGPHRAQSS